MASFLSQELILINQRLETYETQSEMKMYFFVFS